jgi:hypothetical protein
VTGGWQGAFALHTPCLPPTSLLHVAVLARHDSATRGAHGRQGACASGVPCTTRPYTSMHCCRLPKGMGVTVGAHVATAHIRGRGPTQKGGEEP